MPRKPRLEYENAFYHVMNRGRGREMIFHGDEYYQKFVELLKDVHENKRGSSRLTSITDIPPINLSLFLYILFEQYLFVYCLTIYCLNIDNTQFFALFNMFQMLL